MILQANERFWHPSRMQESLARVSGGRFPCCPETTPGYQLPTLPDWTAQPTVKRNQDRFPDDFVFDLTREGILGISQTVTSLHKLRFSKQVHAFTEHGALMAANILNSPRAVAMSVYVIRVFIKMREDLAANAAILKVGLRRSGGHRYKKDIEQVNAYE
jgi:hypothetical protein